METRVDVKGSDVLQEVTFPLPRAPQTNIYLQLRDNGPSILILLTTTTSASTSVSLGSFVYALPNVSFDNRQILNWTDWWGI